jgi:hypothetical protein
MQGMSVLNLNAPNHRERIRARLSAFSVLNCRAVYPDLGRPLIPERER